MGAKKEHTAKLLLKKNKNSIRCFTYCNENLTKKFNVSDFDKDVCLLLDNTVKLINDERFSSLEIFVKLIAKG